MTIRTETKGTAGDILEALALCMKLNSRKQNFHAWAEKEGRGLIVAPMCEYIETARPDDWAGLSLIMRSRVREVPGYADRVASILLDIQKGAVKKQRRG